MWHVRDNLIFAMMNHEYGIKAWDAAEITAATVRARAEMNKMVTVKLLQSINAQLSFDGNLLQQ